MNKTEAAHYIAAMIDGEGCVVHSGHTRNVNIANTDPDLIAAIERCYETLGITYRVVTAKMYDERHKQRWNVIVSNRESLQIIFDRVPIQASRKVEKLRVVLETYRPPRPTSEVLRRMYVDEGMGVTRIGAALGYQQSSIRYWLRRDGVVLRTASEAAKLRYDAGISRPEDNKRKWLESRAS